MINLLPQPEREKLYAHLFKKQINSFGLLITVILLGGVIFTLNTYVFLKIQTNELKSALNFGSISREAEEASKYEKDLERLNTTLAKYQSFKTGNISVADILNNLEDIVPPGAQLKTMSFDQVSKKVIISGGAQSRDDVLLLESRLKKTKDFTRLESPLSNFLEKTNPNFSFTFYLK